MTDDIHSLARPYELTRRRARYTPMGVGRKQEQRSRAKKLSLKWFNSVTTYEVKNPPQSESGFYNKFCRFATSVVNSQRPRPPLLANSICMHTCKLNAQDLTTIENKKFWLLMHIL